MEANTLQPLRLFISIVSFPLNQSREKERRERERKRERRSVSLNWSVSTWEESQGDSSHFCCPSCHSFFLLFLSFSSLSLFLPLLHFVFFLPLTLSCSVCMNHNTITVTVTTQSQSQHNHSHTPLQTDSDSDWEEGLQEQKSVFFYPSGIKQSGILSLLSVSLSLTGQILFKLLDSPSIFFERERKKAEKESEWLFLSLLPHSLFLSSKKILSETVAVYVWNKFTY